MRTNDLRKAIRERLETIKEEYEIQEIYFDLADDDALFPHLVVDFSGDDLSDFNRKDYTIDVDIYTKNMVLLFDISDAIEDLFCNFNDPSETILPTFFLVSKIFVDDEDKTIKHGVVRMEAQLYDY